MNTTKQPLFETVGNAITSLGAVIFVMLSIILAALLFTHSLFLQALPQQMEAWEKALASWSLAIGFESTVLLMVCNTRYINKNFPVFMAIASAVIMLYFLESFDWSQPALIITLRFFIALVVAIINLTYAELFMKRWVEFISAKEQPMKLNDLELKVNELQSRLTEAERERNELQSLRKLKATIDNELTCPHCHVKQATYGSLHAHKGHCTENPKRKTQSI